jgi:hypothetical protein
MVQVANQNTPLATYNYKLPWDAVLRPFGQTEQQTFPSLTNLRFPGQYFDVESALVIPGTQYVNYPRALFGSGASQRSISIVSPEYRIGVSSGVLWRSVVKHARTKVLRFCTVAVTLAIGLTGSHADSFAASFPGTTTELPAPDGRMRVINRDPEDGGKHILLLKEVAAAKEKLLHAYSRHVSVAWSPNSRYLAITDYAESTDAMCFLYDVQSDKKIALAKEAKRSSKTIASLMGNEHAYFTCTQWQNPSSILIKVKAWGRNNPSGKEEFFEYTVGDGFKQAAPSTR